MTLVGSLTLVFAAFCVLMAAVLSYCIRERQRAQREMAARSHQEASAVAQTDRQIIRVLIAAIVAGAVLALTTGYLVFIKTWG